MKRLVRIMLVLIVTVTLVGVLTHPTTVQASGGKDKCDRGETWVQDNRDGRGHCEKPKEDPCKDKGRDDHKDGKGHDDKDHDKDKCPPAAGSSATGTVHTWPTQFYCNVVGLPPAQGNFTYYQTNPAGTNSQALTLLLGFGDFPVGAEVPIELNGAGFGTVVVTEPTAGNFVCVAETPLISLPAGKVCPVVAVRKNNQLWVAANCDPTVTVTYPGFAQTFNLTSKAPRIRLDVSCALPVSVESGGVVQNPVCPS